MQSIFLALLLALIFALFSGLVQGRLRVELHTRPALLWILPPALTVIFVVAAASAGTWNPALTLTVLLYSAVPVLLASLQGPGMIKSPSLIDFVTVLSLWLPLEFPAGAARLVGKHAQGFLHSVAYGIAILLGLIIFIGFRSVSDMKYNLPKRGRDFWLPAAGFAIAAPVLIAIGIGIGFIPFFHLPTAPAGKMAAAAGIIFVATALPEEILFRSLIQNLLMLRFGAGSRTLAAAALIFGAAHLDNGPQPLPNWRYFILATIAGYAYGRVFQKSATVLSSTAFHSAVDWTKHFFF